MPDSTPPSERPAPLLPPSWDNGTGGAPHIRDVRGTPERFVETFHDDGQTDMVDAMRTYAEVDFSGPVRPGQVPTMAGEENDAPGYQTLDRLFALGDNTGLSDAVEQETT